MTTLSNEALAKELLPCPNPWCDSAVPPWSTLAPGSGYWVTCGCGFAACLRSTEAEAITAWNTRTPPVREDVLEVVKHAWDAGYSTGQDYRDDPPFAGLGKHNRRHGWETYACSLSDRNLVVSATTTPENSELVTQADRDAAADYLKIAHPMVWGANRRIRLREFGDHDDHPLVQAFARHRIEATREAQATPAGEVGELVEHLSGPHEWGYRDLAEGGFIEDRAPFKAADTITSLQATVSRLEAALTFYADAWTQEVDAERTAHGWVGSIGPVEPSEDLLNDMGNRARAALTEPTTKYGRGSTGPENGEG